MNGRKPEPFFTTLMAIQVGTDEFYWDARWPPWYTLLGIDQCFSKEKFGMSFMSC
jgi:hypothetical protein